MAKEYYLYVKGKAVPVSEEISLRWSTPSTRRWSEPSPDARLPGFLPRPQNAAE